MKLVYRGAESLVYLDDYEGENSIIKERIPKNYRIKNLDDKLRKERTKKEVKLLTEARKIGVPTPRILHVDEKNFKIVMERIDGTMVRDFLNSSNKDVERVCFEIGKLVGKLHQNNIIHGDLTTSNMILKDSIVYFIDFSLGDISSRVENKGVDLNLFSEALSSTHFKIYDKCWHNFLAGYEQEYLNAKQIIEKVKEIKKRVRYAERGEN